MELVAVAVAAVFVVRSIVRRKRRPITLRCYFRPDILAAILREPPHARGDGFMDDTG